MLAQDIYQKKSELLCPECRKPVEVAIDSLPPNILANRILEVRNLKSRCYDRHKSVFFPGNDAKAKSLENRSSFSGASSTRAQGSSPPMASPPPTKEAGHETGRDPKTSGCCTCR